jgi:hypothetical protein
VLKLEHSSRRIDGRARHPTEEDAYHTINTITIHVGFQEASTASEVARELASPLFQRSFHIAYGCEAPLWRLSFLVA